MVVSVFSHVRVALQFSCVSCLDEEVVVAHATAAAAVAAAATTTTAAAFIIAEPRSWPELLRLTAGVVMAGARHRATSAVLSPAELRYSVTMGCCPGP